MVHCLHSFSCIISNQHHFCLDFAEYQWYKYTKKPVKESKYLLPDVTENRRWWKGGTKSRWEWAPEGERNCQESFRRRTKHWTRSSKEIFSEDIKYASRRGYSVIKISIYEKSLSGQGQIQLPMAGLVIVL